MLETEVKLRKAINELFHIVRMNAFMKKAQTELSELLDFSDYSVMMFEGEPKGERYSEAKAYFESLLNKVKNSYGTDSVSNAYNCFKTALDDEEFLEVLQLEETPSAEDKKEIFCKVFDDFLIAAENWESELDCYSYFIEKVKEILMPINEKDTQREVRCPYCQGEPKILEKSVFFGPQSKDNVGNVYACECGAYALLDDEDKIVGKLGDAILHQNRGNVKQAIFELCKMAGMTLSESFRWFSVITGVRLEKMNDVEYLDSNSCKLAIRLYAYARTLINEQQYSYPKTRDELFMFFVDGGRLSVCNAYGFQSGKLLIPAEVGVDGIKVYGKNGIQSISFSADLDFAFDEDSVYIVHPSKKKEKFRMIPAEMRSDIINLSIAKFAETKAG